jgi:hypothetical protein
VEWLGPALVCYVAVAAILVARRRLTRVESLRIGDLAKLLRAIKSGSDEDLAVVGAGAPTESFENLVISAIIGDASSELRIATVNEHLNDLDRELDSQRDVPKMIARGALLSGTFACVLELSLTVTRPSGPAWSPAAASFLLGLAGFMASLRFDARARHAAKIGREEWDRVASALAERMGRGVSTPKTGS